jgi:hypothetical protein
MIMLKTEDLFSNPIQRCPEKVFRWLNCCRYNLFNKLKNLFTNCIFLFSAYCLFSRYARYKFSYKKLIAMHCAGRRRTGTAL